MNTIKVYTINEQGYVVQEHILEEKVPGVLYLPIIPDAVTVSLPATSGTQKPRWNGSSWVLEGESQEQIDQRQKEQERLREEELQKQKELEEQERLKQEELQRQEEIKRLEKLIQDNNELNNLSQGQYERILAQIAQLKQ